MNEALIMGNNRIRKVEEHALNRDDLIKQWAQEKEHEYKREVRPKE